MTHDVDDIAVRRSNEEPSNAPFHGSYRVHDLEAEFAGFFVRAVEVIRVDCDNRIFERSCIARFKLNVFLVAWRRVASTHPRLNSSVLKPR